MTRGEGEGEAGQNLLKWPLGKASAAGFTTGRHPGCRLGRQNHFSWNRRGWPALGPASVLDEAPP